jgi:hypothetical protein|tara:strand:- start:1828 stop:2157 length:330 start_codon:yes stop_codon:yes gene_type:complete
MGKITIAEATKLVEDGALTEEAVTSMQERGLISVPKTSNKRYIMTVEGNWVSPRFYFSGLRGQTTTTEMQELKTKVNDIFNAYTVGETDLPTITDTYTITETTTEGETE